jgi:mono/diheme cytochrome c family protein
MKRNKILAFAALLTLLITGSCDRNRNHPGWDYFPDMFYSPAYESYTPNPNFEDGKSMRMPVEGTVPRELVPFDYSIEESERTRAGEELMNPFTAEEAVLQRGKEAYEAFCLNCHGEKGDGQGYLYTSGRYIAIPRSLIGETAQDLKDGEIYHSITVGFGSMGSHASQVRPEDRWKIVTYIREVLQKNVSVK